MSRPMFAALLCGGLLTGTASAASVPSEPSGDGGGDGAGAHGAPGYGRVVSTRPATEGRLGVGLRTTFFQKTPFPTEGRNRLMTGELFLRYGLPRGFEFYGAWRTASNSNSAAVPSLVQSQGDLTLGSRWLHPHAGFWRGADVRANLLHPVGGDLWALASSQLELRALGGAQRVFLGRPLSLDVNVGLAFGAYAGARGERVTPVVLLGSDLSGYHRLVAAAGVAWSFARWTPYAAVDLDIPMGVPKAALSAARVSAGAVTGRGLLLGGRLPVGPGIVDLGLQLGAGSGVAGVAPTPPWTLLAGYLWHPAVPTKPADAPPAPLPPPPLSPGLLSLPATVRHAGVVIDAASQQPVGRVIVSLGSRPPVATGADGRFETPELALGAQTLELSRDGYRTATFAITLGSDDKVASYLLEPVAAPAPSAPAPTAPVTAVATSAPETATTSSGFVAGRLDSGDGRPLAGVLVLSGAADERWLLEAEFQHRLTAGTYALTALPESHFARRWTVVVEADAVAVVAGRLEPRPPTSGYAVDGEELVPKKPLLLDEKSPSPPSANEALLGELADALLRDPSKRLVIGVHADAAKSGSDDRMEWTRVRASALAQWFIDRGVARDQVEATGYGMTDPIVPSLVKDKSKNRRVSLVLTALAAGPFGDPAMETSPVSPAAPSVPDSPAAPAPGGTGGTSMPSADPSAPEPAPEFELPDIPF
jgi:hypothetical protein